MKNKCILGHSVANKADECVTFPSAKALTKNKQN